MLVPDGPPEGVALEACALLCDQLVERQCLIAGFEARRPPVDLRWRGVTDAFILVTIRSTGWRRVGLVVDTAKSGAGVTVCPSRQEYPLCIGSFIRCFLDGDGLSHRLP